MYVPKRNIEPMMVDVKRPGFNYAAGSRRRAVNLRLVPVEPKRKAYARVARNVGIVSLALVLIGGGIGLAKVGSIRHLVAQKEENITEQFRSSVRAMKELDMQNAKRSLAASLSDLQEVHAVFGTDTPLFRGIASIVPLVRNLGGFVSQLTSFNADLLNFSGVVEGLQEDGVQEFLHDGKALISRIGTLEAVTEKIRAGADALRDSTSKLSGIEGLQNIEPIMRDYYLSYGSTLYALSGFVNELKSLLASPEEQHILILFQNDSELRPGGGFLGSYGVLTVKGGQMQDFTVNDIYWPDHPLNFDLKLIPPKPLQRVTEDWGARDANWFFNFPDSAEAVLTLLEQSEVYAASSTTFTGAIAVNTRVLESLIAAVGPIPLDEYDMTVTRDNFLPELQREVETGRDKQPGKNPKKILSVLAPKLLERLEGLSPDGTSALMERVGEHVANKDIMFYFRNEVIENALVDYGVDGSVYTLPKGYWGSYLGVVNANIAGGKSDAVMSQDVEAWLDVGVDGSSVGNVAVRRTHHGTAGQDSWYQADNTDYLKLFVNDGSELLLMKGNDVRRDAVRTYGKEYETYPAVAAIEGTRIYLRDQGTWQTEEAGKEVFGTWLITERGETRELNFKYHTPGATGFALSEGKVFQFVFDKQSGSDTGLKIHVSAPIGYVWKETGAPVYTAEFPNVSKREIINLTLAKKG